MTSSPSATEGSRRSGGGGAAHVLLRVLLFVVFLTGCDGGGADSSSEWPEWQLLETTGLPSSWRMEEASPAFDSWNATVIVTRLSAGVAATEVQFEGEGGTLDVRLAAFPAGSPHPSLSVGDTVRLTLIRRVGFEGVAHGLTLLDSSGQLLLLYDDGGYGPAYFDSVGRGGVHVERSPDQGGSSETWAAVPVTFGVGGDSVLVAEGEFDRLRESDLVVAVVVSREWMGPVMTDVDLTPLAYLVYRPSGAR